jgi:hypothetical protein
MLDYRGHRIAAINAGPSGWHAYVDMFDVGDARTQQDALDVARHWIDDAIRTDELQRSQIHRVAPRSGRPALRLVHDTDQAEHQQVPCFCCGRPSSHHCGLKRLCCACYVRIGNPPANWHLGCMATFAKAQGQIERMEAGIGHGDWEG